MATGRCWLLKFFSEFAREYRSELKRLQTSQIQQRQTHVIKLGDIKARIDRIVDAIADGTASSALEARLSELDAEKSRLEAATSASRKTDALPEIHPNLPQLYKRRVTDLQQVLAANAADRDAAAEILRSLIAQIVVNPGKRRGETVITSPAEFPLFWILPSAGQPRFAGRKCSNVGAQVRN